MKIRNIWSFSILAVITIIGVFFLQRVQAGSTDTLAFTDTFDALTTGDMSGQNGWVKVSSGSCGNAWVIESDGASGKVARNPTNNCTYYDGAMLQTGATYLDTRIKFDFKAASRTPAAWLRKQGTTAGNAGYVILRYDNVFYLSFHNGGGAQGLGNVSPSLTAGAWYTMEFEVVNDGSNNPVINFWVYAQGASRPGTPTLTYTDTGKLINVAGYPGIGIVDDGTFDNVYIYSGDVVAPTVPGAPTSPVATSDEDSVDLSWTAPASNGGSDITDYIIEYRTGSNSYATFSDGVSTATTATVTGLSSGTSYDFKIWSKNSVGTSTSPATVSTTTVAVAPDTTPPTVSLTAPAASALLRGSGITISATAEDDEAVAGVTFKIGNTALAAEDTSSPYSISWNSADVSDGSKNIIAVARDTSNNYATSSAVAVTVDNTVPVISSISSGTPGETSATITWTTDTVADSQINYGETSSYTASTTLDSSMSTSHSVTISGLTQNTTYHFRVRSTDAAGNLAVSADTTFTTAATPVDATAPAISSISSGTPTANAATITWATDEAASSRVEYGLTSSLGTLTSETDTSPRVTNHSVSLTGLLACTTYYYKVTSKDAALNVATSSAQSFITADCSGSAAITAESDAAITSDSGGTVALIEAGRGPTLTIPADFAGEDADFQVKKLASTEALQALGTPTGLTLAGNHVYDFKAYTDPSTALTTFAAPITVSVQYTDSDVAFVDETTLTIKRFNGSTWSDLSSCSVDVVANSVTCMTSNFSVFGLFGQADTAGTRTSTGGGQGFVNTSVVLAPAPTQTPTSSATSTPAFPVTELVAQNFLTRTLVYGMVHEQVRLVQKVLNMSSDTQVSESGAGSPGNETSNFLTKTLAAVKKFQLKYLIVKTEADQGYGIVGPLTRKKMNELLNASSTLSR